MTGFKQALKEARRRSGITQRDAANETSIALGTLRRWEQGVNEPDIESLVRLADLYGVTVGEVLGVPEGPSERLTSDEQRLLDLYRATDGRGRASIMSVAEAQQAPVGQYRVVIEPPDER